MPRRPSLGEHYSDDIIKGEQRRFWGLGVAYLEKGTWAKQTGDVLGPRVDGDDQR